MLAKIAARNRFFPEFWKVSQKKSTKLGPHSTVQAKFGWDLREFQTFGLLLSAVLQLKTFRWKFDFFPDKSSHAGRAR